MSFAVGWKPRRTILKACLFLIFLCGAVILGNYGPLRESLTAEGLGQVLLLTGAWCPVLFVLLYGVGICLFIPAIVLTGLGATIFGAYWGFLFTWAGALLGASGAFFISRVLARDFVSSRIGDRLRQYDDAIGRNGFTTVLFHAHVLWNGRDEGPVPGLPSRNRARDCYRHVCRDLSYWKPEGPLGFRRLAWSVFAQGCGGLGGPFSLSLDPHDPKAMEV
jgi:hypothetical protein